MIYLLDTDVLISANNRYYQPEVFPSVWDWIVAPSATHTIQSIEEVKNEIKGKSNLSV